MKTIVLTFDDASKSHLEVAVPVLKKYGFNATFFISLPEVWLNECPAGYLSHDEIAELYKMGFELGNHTMHHHVLTALDDDGIRREISMCNDFFRKIGAPEAVSFAYPGGPYAPNGAKIIPESGLKYARTTEHALWTCETDPMRIPCYSVCNKQLANFSEGLELLGDRDDAALVLLYHGVPDIAHAHCSTDAEIFAEHMKYLYDNGYKVISMREYGEMLK